MKKHHFSHSTIEHHSDGSHTIHHHHESDSKKDVKHAAAGHDEMVDSLMDHTAPPSPEMEQAEAGQHGIPAPAAAAAGIPAPPPAAGA